MGMSAKRVCAVVSSMLAFALIASATLAQPRKVSERVRRDSDQFVQSAVLAGDASPEALPPAIFPMSFRTIDGHQNNIAHPLWGAADVPFLRLVQPGYADGVGLPAGADRPSARAISNAVAAQSVSTPNPLGASDYLWQWGQFLDHDITETPLTDPPEPFNIAVPFGDVHFDVGQSGQEEIGLTRSAFVTSGGVREQINFITAFIDASNVYGSEDERAEVLRLHDGTGRLATSEGDLLPFNTFGLANAMSAADPTLFVAGDVRANEQIGLIALHTLFVREHNYWAGIVRFVNPWLDDETIYQYARAIVAAEMQAITYNEFLPLLLGEHCLPPYQGYKEAVNPGISNVFATAGYRVGHTMLSPTLLRREADGTPIPQGDIALKDAFFAPALVTETGIDPILRGLAWQPAQRIDNLVIDDVRNFLFGPPGAGGFDLVSLNIQRGRDHGIGSYNQVRVAFGLPAVTSFDQIHPSASVWQPLADAYGDVDTIDAWVGLLAEKHERGALVGPTLKRVLADQFLRLRDGDRFFYLSYLPDHMIEMVEEQTLAVIIRRNTSIGSELQDDVFRVPCWMDLNADGSMDFFDIAKELKWIWLADPMGDLNGDTSMDADDVWIVMDAVASGCE